MSNYNSNIVTANNPAKFGVYETNVFGTVLLANGITLTQDDTITLCKIPANTILTDFVISLPDMDSATSLVVKLQDNQASPVVYTTTLTTGQGGGLISFSANVVGAVIGTTYSTQQLLQIIVTTTAGGALSGPVTIYFKVAFSPV